MIGYLNMNEEICSNCSKVIGISEQAYLYKENIVCLYCYRKLYHTKNQQEQDTFKKPVDVHNRIPSDLSILPEVFIVADVETTGLNPDYDEIIEIGAIKVNRDSNEHLSFEAIVKPMRPISKKITQITGITQEMLEGGDPLESAISEFLDFIGDLRIVFYNAPFDVSFLKKAAKKIHRKLPNKISDALKMARKAFPGLPSYKLSDLAQVGNVDVSDAHSAIGDCKMTMIVYAAAANRLKRIS